MISVHMMGAAILKTPELVLDPKEAASLATAAAEVAKHYPVSLNPKIMAWANFAMVAGGIYGPRIVAIHNRHKSEARESKPKLVTMDTGARQPPAKTEAGSAAPRMAFTNPSQLYGLEYTAAIQE